MRIAFVNALTKLARKNAQIMLLTGDLGFSVFEDYRAGLPGQYVNAGVAEQNMTGVAAGLAMEGKIPIIYSIVPFVTMRNFEQIRNDICYQNLNVKIVGIGAGFSYGPYGHTHHGLEDIGVFRTLAGMTILAPGDPIEVELATEAMIRHIGPVYLRLGKKGEPNIHKRYPEFKIGKGLVVAEGKDIAIITTSNMLERGYQVIKELEKHSISAALISMPTIKPFDVSLILGLLDKVKGIFTLEEHSIIGGLGSTVAEVIAESGKSTKFKRIGVPDRFTKTIGTQEYMQEANGLSCMQIVTQITQLLQHDKRT